jgi:D-alanine-D-alanine ligase
MLGGPSAEREVSLRSGSAAAAALRARGHEVSELDPRDDSWTLPAGTEVVFLALHGTYGEDGTVQRRLEKLGVPYTGCGPEASLIAFDKVLTKEACLRAGVPTARFFVVDKPDAPWPSEWKPPVVLKPVRQGSSVGLHFVEQVSDWPNALADALQYDSRVLVEERVAGREVTAGILGNDALPLVEVRPKSGVLDYRNKYTVGASEYFCPARFDADATRHAQHAALDAFKAVGGRDYARIDIIMRPDDTPVVLEVNTLPGMTETSLLPKAAAAIGIDYGELCQRMVELALQH